METHKSFFDVLESLSDTSKSLSVTYENLSKIFNSHLSLSGASECLSVLFQFPGGRWRKETLETITESEKQIICPMLFQWSLAPPGCSPKGNFIQLKHTAKDHKSVQMIVSIQLPNQALVQGWEAAGIGIVYLRSLLFFT